MKNGMWSTTQHASYQMLSNSIWIWPVMGGLKVAAKSLETADKVVQKLPVVRSIRGLVIDTVLGPEEPLDYVSRTVSQPISSRN